MDCTIKHNQDGEFYVYFTTWKIERKKKKNCSPTMFSTENLL